MPILNKKTTISDNVTIWNITEDIFALENLFGDKDIIHQAQKIKNPLKKKQFLASRLLLKNILGDWNVKKTEHGKPFQESTNKHFSITHDQNFVALITHSSPCGIDIQKISPKTIRIKDKFVNELDIYSDSLDESELTMLWCAKEALYKIHGIPSVFFKEHIIVEKGSDSSLLRGKIILDGDSGNYSLKVHRIENYYLVYTI